VVRVDDVFKIYASRGSETVALRGASLQVGQGEFVALVGRSGSGKSTLLQLIAGLDTPSAGRVHLEEQNIGILSEEERAELRRRIVGIVLQRDNLVPYLTALENVALPLQLAGAPNATPRAKALLERVGLGHRLDHRARQLSGGEAQRVGIAIALAAEPHVLLADEVTGELDSETASEILQLLAELHQHDRLSLLVVTHNKAVAQNVQRVLLMRDGLVEPNV
jgi:putative ABC transport system ATP-binding protein